MPLSSGFLKKAVAGLVSVSALSVLFFLQANAVGNRFIPSNESGHSPIVVVRTQKDAYQVCKDRAVRGATVVTLGKHFNLQFWAPEYLAKSVPFPIQTFDVIPEYEQALESHNWLFIANQTGMVRKVLSILPPEEFHRREQDLKSDYALYPSNDGYKGFHYDLPRSVTILDRLLPVDETVIVVVDASYFAPDVDPAATARELVKRLPSVVLFIMVSSLDEGELSWAMRRNMSVFIRTWQEGG